MSEIAEYAASLHQKEASHYPRDLVFAECSSRVEELKNIRAVIFDVYGTLINYWRPGFQTTETREQTLLGSFKTLADRFGMSEYLLKIEPGQPPEKTLADFYRGLILMGHQKAEKKGIVCPEIKIEEVWNIIILMLQRHGYVSEKHCPGKADELSRYVAFTYNFLSLGRELYPGVYSALQRLKEDQIVLGILSNAQFYTPIDLTLLFRDQSGGEISDIQEIFDTDLTFFSYEYGVSKPGELLFSNLYNALYEMHIVPSQTVFVGNDLVLDIEPAQTAGMNTALFTGDQSSAYFHDKKEQVIPDICFKSWDELSARISFHG